MFPEVKNLTVRRDTIVTVLAFLVIAMALPFAIDRHRCTPCHGDPAHPKSPLADSLNSPPPQFMDDMPDMPENQNFYIREQGIRRTAMPGWKNVFTAQQIWQTVTFLSHMNDLPSAAKQVFTETASCTQPLPGSH